MIAIWRTLIGMRGGLIVASLASDQNPAMLEKLVVSWRKGAGIRGSAFV